jgi:hypothetical protein
MRSIKIIFLLIPELLPFLTTSFLAVSFFSITSSAEEQSVYVKAKSIQLKKEPNNSADSLIELVRGDKLKVLTTQGLWLQVESKEKVGWISKVFTSDIKPVGQTELLNDSKVNSAAKTSRRRSNEYAVSAAARGLTATERNRNSVNKQRSNRQAVSDLEKIKVEDKEVDQFKNEGQEK